MNRTNRAWLATAAAAATVSAAYGVGEPHNDIHLTVVDGKLVTNKVAFTTPGQPVTPNVRVFTRDFGELGFEFYTDDPGFNAFSGTLPNDTNIWFDIVDALRIWDPSAGDFDTIAPGTIEMGEFGFFVETPASAGEVVTGLRIADTGDVGGFHEHFEFYINPPNPGGMYLLTLIVRTDDGSLEPTDPIYVVFRYQEDLQNPDPTLTYDEPVAYLEALVAPACIGDADGDADTDLDDFSVLAVQFGAAVEPGTGADFDGSGIVDLDDFSVLAVDFGCGEQ